MTDQPMIGAQPAPGGAPSAAIDDAHRELELDSSSAVRGLFGRDAVYMALWAVQLGVAALSTPLMTRLLGAASFGYVASAVAVMQVLVAIGSLSLQTAVQRHFAQPGGEVVARRIITVAILSSITTFVIAEATARIWCPALGLGPYGWTIRLAVIWAALTAISNAALGLLRSRDQLRAFATVSLLQSVVAEALALALVATVAHTAGAYLLGQAVAQGSAVVISLALTRPLRVARDHIRVLSRAARYSAALVPAALATFVLEASDRLVIQRDLGSVEVARYAVAYNIGSISIILLGVLNTVWMPRMFSLADDRLRQAVMAESRDALLLLMGPVTVALGAGAPLLLKVWVPASYHPETLPDVVWLISVTGFAVAGVLATTRRLLVSGRTMPIAGATAAAAAANLALNVVLVPRLHIFGSALATVISYAMLAGILLASARGEHPVPRPAARALCVATIATVVSYGLARAPWTGTTAVLRGAVIALAGLAFLVVLLDLVLERPHPKLATLARIVRQPGAASPDAP